MDKLCMENYLLILKSTVEVYVHGTLESTNDDIRLTLKNGLNETMLSQACTYQIMMDNNWYSVPNIDSQIIKDTLTKLESSN